MLRFLPAAMAAACLAAPADRGVMATSQSPFVQQKNLDHADVRWTSGFWAERFATVQRATLPAIFSALADPRNGAQYASFLKDGGADPKTLNWWSDGDVYKTVEAMALVNALSPDPALEKKMAEMIAAFAAAQEPDGYISSPIRVRKAERWKNLNNHELYNMGHLMTAAAVHYRATGRKEFFDVATRTADYLYGVFMPRPKALAHFGFNPSNIMGSVELYRTTRDRRYLELAGTFVTMRGSAPGGSDQNQSKMPLRKETQAVGHAVTGNYLYAGAADVYAETGERALLEAVQRLWDDVVTKKMYVTGAVGGVHQGVSPRNEHTHEAFNFAWELHNRIAYNETCANTAQAMFGWRLLGITSEPRYADTMELILYNSMLSGMSVEGREFYYNNPLRRHGDELPRVLRPADPPLRSTVLKCYCCPTTLARTIAGLNGWAYAKSGDTLWVNLYGGNRLDTALAAGRLKLTQTTEYPWEGDIRIAVEEAPPAAIALQLRIPAWASGATVAVNDEAPRPVPPGKYAALRRTWRRGDRVRLQLPMEPRLVMASPYVDAARNQAAVMRGPLVYCLESPDLPSGVRVSDVVLPADAKLTAHREPGLLGGVTVIEGRAKVAGGFDLNGPLYQTLRPAAARTEAVRLIPYFAWANRGMSHMSVWIPLSW